MKVDRVLHALEVTVAVTAAGSPPPTLRLSGEDCGDLLEEIRRLRALIAKAENASSEETMYAGSSVCPWCEAPIYFENVRARTGRRGAHTQDCPAFMADGRVK